MVSNCWKKSWQGLAGASVPLRSDQRRTEAPVKVSQKIVGMLIFPPFFRNHNPVYSKYKIKESLFTTWSTNFPKLLQLRF